MNADDYANAKGDPEVALCDVGSGIPLPQLTKILPQARSGSPITMKSGFSSDSVSL